MRESHIVVAQRDGAKAGFKVWKRSLEASGLPKVRVALAEVNAAGNAKAQFDFYCAKFGEQFGNQPVETDEIAELRAKLAELEARSTPVIQDGRSGTRKVAARVASVVKPKPKTSAIKPAFFRPWAIAKHGIPTTVGASFTYKGKRRNTKFVVATVTADGVTANRA